MKNVEKDVVLNEVKKELNWRERIIVHISKKTFIKVYQKGKVDYYKYLSKK